MFDNAFAQLGKEAPLYWLDEYSDTIEEIKESKQNRFLVTTYELARGFEDNLVINLVGVETYSRASAYLVTLCLTSNWYYLALSTLTSIIYEEHDDSFDHQLNLDSPLVTIGKNHQNCIYMENSSKVCSFQIRNCLPWDYNDLNSFLEEL